MCVPMREMISTDGMTSNADVANTFVFSSKNFFWSAVPVGKTEIIFMAVD